ncbi:MAG: hypothetical protein IT165_03865 [Bryobacterales bacterium]|nr:hypothetical protein [Bryobacterales bacterium]
MYRNVYTFAIGATLAESQTLALAVASASGCAVRSAEPARSRARLGFNRHERYEASASLRDWNAQYARLRLLLLSGRHGGRSVVAARRCFRAGSEGPHLRLGYELGEAVLVSWGDCKDAVMNEGANDNALDVQYRRRLTEVQECFLAMGSLADRSIHAQIVEAK